MQFAIYVLSTILLVCTPAVFAESSWPQWRGPDRDGKAVSDGSKLDWTDAPPAHQWTIDGMGSGYASVAVVGDRLYTTGNFSDGQAVICVDLKAQRQAWKTPLTNKSPEHGFKGSRCTPSIDGDRCYVVASNGQIACLSTSDGEVLWSRSFQDDFHGKMMSGWGFSESPLVDGDWVLCTPGGNEAMIVALDKMSGKEIWRTSVSDLGEKGKDGAGYSSIVISHGAGVKQYVQLVGRGVIGVRASDGELLWSYNDVANGTANIPTPIPFGDYVFASTGYGTGAALLKLNAAGRNKVEVSEEYFLNSRTFQNHHGGMILDGEYVYAGHQHNKGIPICLHVPTGEVKWVGRTRNQKLDMQGSAAITYVNGQIIYRYQNGTVALINATPEGFQVQGAFTPDYQEGKTWSHPVIVGNMLYLREQDKLMCYRL